MSNQYTIATNFCYFGWQLV